MINVDLKSIVIRELGIYCICPFPDSRFLASGVIQTLEIL